MTAAMSRRVARASRADDKEMIARFLRGCFLREECAKLELRHMSGVGTAPVFDWDVSQLVETERNPEFLSQAIDEMATSDAASLRGFAKYIVFVYRKGADEPWARHTFNKHGALAGEGEGETEEPTNEGVIRMLMRGHDAKDRVMLASNATILQHYQRIIVTQDAQLGRFEEAFERILNLQERLADESAKRAVETRKADSEERRKDRIMDQLELAAPVLLGKVLPAGQKEVAVVASIKALFKSLKPEQFDAILGALDDGQRIAVMGAYETFLKEEEAREKNEKDAEKKLQESEGKAESNE